MTGSLSGLFFTGRNMVWLRTPLLEPGARDRVSRVSNSGCRAAEFCSRLTYEGELRRANLGRRSVVLGSQCDRGMHILSLNRIPGVNLSCLAVGIVAFFFNVGIVAFSVCCLTSCLSPWLTTSGRRLRSFSCGGKNQHWSLPHWE